MARQEDAHVFSGMQQDMAVSKCPAQYLIDAHNIRITRRDNGTLLTITNEKGTQDTEERFRGVCLGHAVLNNQLVLFTKEEGIESPDRIYKTEFNNGEYTTTLLYQGNLNFDLNYPIETLPYYENDLIQKIYWTDNFNQPRLINIAADFFKRNTWTDTAFDFVPELNLQETVTVEKNASDTGYFKAGTIQYAFNYYNLYGQESNIFYTTKLYYTSFYDRAGEVDQMVSNAFNITINNIDTRFDYVRVYSIQRNAQDVSPLVKIVTDVKIEKGGRIVDDTRVTNYKWAYSLYGNIEDPNECLQYAVDGNTFSDVELYTLPQVQIWFAGVNRNFRVIDTQGGSDPILRTSDRDLKTSGRYFYIMENEYPYMPAGNGRYIFAGNGTIEDQPVQGGETRKVLVDTTDIEVYYKKNNSVTITDNGMHGETIDPSKLLYIGGEEILAYTMTHKDGTMFMGNIKISRPSIPPEIKDAIQSLKDQHVTISEPGQAQYALSCCDSYQETYNLTKISDSPYPYYTGLHINTSGFKHAEYYRLGLQFQYKNGKWSEPCWVGDFQQEAFPKLEDGGTAELKMPSFYVWLRGPFTYDPEYKNIQQYLINKGYKKVRGVVVVPQKEERTILCQGVANPTLYTKKERAEGAGFATVHAYNSWFFRAMNSSGCCESQNQAEGETTGGGVSPQSVGTLMGIKNYTLISGSGYTAIWPHGSQTSKGFRNYAWGKGIEMSYDNLETSDPYFGEELFNIDWSFLTLNSPELEFTEYFYSTDFTGAIVHDVGRIPIDKTMADIDITTSTPRISEDGAGFVHTSVVGNGSCGIISLPCYNDGLVNEAFEGSEFGGNFLCLLWNGEGSLNNDISRSGIDSTSTEYNEDRDGAVTVSNHGERSALLQFKKVSNLRISYNTYYDTAWEGTAFRDHPLSLTAKPVFYGDKEPVIEKVGGHIYYGNVDKAMGANKAIKSYFVGPKVMSLGDIQPPQLNGDYHGIAPQYRPKDLFTVWSAAGSTKETAWFTVSGKSVALVGFNQSNAPYDTPIIEAIGDKYSGLESKKIAGHIRFRSAPHMVMSLTNKYIWNTSATTTYCGDVYDGPSQGDYIMYNLDYDDADHHVMNASYLLPILEVRKEKSDNMFGGNTQEALLKNIWLPAGEPVMLSAIENTKVKFTEGDTWYQRYDCLKTQAFSKEDKNQVIEILSFMVETHVNLEGRYDRNRGQLSNVNMSSINFNMMNPAYTQLDNFFNYKLLQEDQYELQDFPTQFTWSLQKKIGSEIDDWTNVNMGSSYNVDGKLGSITDLVTWNDKIFCFQEKGISQIMFNSRVQIPTSDNVPIEITNNYKVDGVQYLSDSLGSENKWSVCPTSAALYFIDYTTRDLYAIGGQGINNLAVSKNMSLWFRKLPVGESKPNAYTVRLFHDKQYGDLYILTENESLVFSETLGEFTSFMSYKKLPMMENINNDFYALHSVLSESQSELLERKEGLYKMFAGNYNNFFGEIKPYDITFVSNGVSNDKNLSTFEKIFTNLEAITDYWKVRIRDTENKDLSVEDEYPLNKFSFNKIKVWNEYQDTKEVELQRLASPSNLKKKFRLWRIQLPRNKKFDINNNYKMTGLIDRIRNPWAKIKLINDNPGTNAMQLHHLNVSYFI